MKMETVVDLCLGTEMGAVLGCGVEWGLRDSCTEPEAPQVISEH